MTTLCIVKELNASARQLLKDDPVRPDIAPESRVGPYGEIMYLQDDTEKTHAVLCVKYCTEIPATVDELINDPGNDEVAVFYTIWSYKAGAGAQLIFKAVDHIKQDRPSINRFVTLSPRTETARRFHLRNGAMVYRENPDTVNFQYL